MSLHLDARQRRMLEEFGIRLFDPLPAPADADVAPAMAPAVAPAMAPSGPSSFPPAVAAPRSAPAPEAVQVLARAPARPPAPGSTPGEGLAALGWDELAATVAACRACRLCEGRRQAVFGAGPRQADWLVVGDPPSEEEEQQGAPFVGQAGKLLDNMLGALGLDRARQVYLTNVLKCRSPGNRNPEPQELAECEAVLRRQVALLQPKVILAMGRFAVPTLVQSTEPIGKLRGRVHHYEGIPVVVTYHPAHLLRNLPAKAGAWADLCLARSLVR